MILPIFLAFLGSAQADLDKDLVEAVRRNDRAATSRLLQAGASPDGPKDAVTSPLALACLQRSAIVYRLLQAGADPNRAGRDGLPPLHAAVIAKGSTGSIKTLVGYGAKLDAFDRDSEATPLYFSLWADEPGSNRRLADLLLELGADPDVGTAYHRTPLMLAADRCDAALVEKMCRRTRDVDRRLERKNAPRWPTGWTALHHAVAPQGEWNLYNWLGSHRDVPLPDRVARPEYLRTVRALVSAGADPSIRDESGRRPIDLLRGAKNYGSLRRARILRNVRTLLETGGPIGDHRMSAPHSSVEVGDHP